MAMIKLPVAWEVSGFVEVEANNIEEAVEYFNKNSDYIKLPDKNEYSEGSFNLSTDDLEYIAFFNENISIS